MLPTIGNATLCGDRRGRGAKTRGFFFWRFFAVPPQSGRGARTQGFLRFFDMPARPSAEIGVVEVQKLEVFCVFCGARATLCGDRRGRGAKARVFFLRFLRCPRDPLQRLRVSKRSRCGAVRIRVSLDEPSAEIVRVEALSLWRRAILLLAKWPLEVVSWFARLLSPSRGCGFDSPLVRGSSGLKIEYAARGCRRGPRRGSAERAPAAPAEKSQLLSTDVVCGACSRSSGWKIATFKYKSSTRSVLPQLRLENRNFLVQK